MRHDIHCAAPGAIQRADGFGTTAVGTTAGGTSGSSGLSGPEAAVVMTPRPATGHAEAAAVSFTYGRSVADFPAAHPGGTVVEIGTGLNTRCERLDNGRD